MKYLIQILMMYCLFGCSIIQAQHAVPASGGNASGTGGTASYTVGQTVYTIHEGSSGIVIQGCQQPYEIYVLTGLSEAAGIKAEFSVYPNPSSGMVKLMINQYDPSDLSLRLFNSDGRLILNRKITGKETIIEMQELPAAAYYLQINDDQKEIKTFVIIKY